MAFRDGVAERAGRHWPESPNSHRFANDDTGLKFARFIQVVNKAGVLQASARKVSKRFFCLPYCK